MRSPCRVEFVSDLDRNEDSSRSFPSGWCQAFTMGSPVSGHVAHFCALDRNEGFFRSSILSCLVMGSPCRLSVFFSHSIVTKSALDIWSVFLQDGVTPVGSVSVDLISNEGITTVGLLGAVFSGRPRGVFVSSFGRLVCSEAGWVPHSVVFASGEGSVCIPLVNEGVGLGPSSGPVASRPPLGIGLLWRPRGDPFHLGVFMRWSSTHGGLLAALLEVGLLGMSCWCMFRVPQILCITPLPGVRAWLLFLA